MKQIKEKKKTVHTETGWEQVYNRCIARSQKPLSQLRTRSSQGVYSVHYTASCTINPAELERAGLSFLPIAKSGRCPERWRANGKDWGSMYGISDWKPESWRCSYGIQIFTGSPSGDITDFDFEFAMIRDHPDVFIATLQQLCALVDNPLLVITKRGGLRFSVRTPGYVHPIREKIVIATWKNHCEHDRLYLEIFGEKGLSRYDARYEIVSGSLLNMPVVDYRPVLEVVDALREQIGTPKPKKPILTKSTTPSQQRDDVFSVEFVDALPSDLRWVERSDGSSMSFRSDYPCQVTKHTKSAGSAQYYKQLNGQIDAFCHNCQEPWIVKKSDTLQRPIAKISPSEVRETPSFPHFSTEERMVVDEVLGISPDAGWHGQIPVFSTKYEHLYKLTNKFALNGQPSAVEKRRVWSTLFGNCKICGAVTAKWIDRYLLTAGLYCDGCHKDYHLGSYLELELLRRLENSIVSDYHGFLGNDPKFKNFHLWEPQVLTHLGAGMGTGKSTAIYKAIIALASEGTGKGIIAVPRVSLARFLAHDLRNREGSRYSDWGLWHEGVSRSDRFIGRYGAIVCLPSLPRAVQCAEDNGVTQLHIAIDELDFSYDLLSLPIERATAVKKCLRDALEKTGLVVSGQTESTLSLEAVAEEIGAGQVHGFYNTVKPTDGAVVMHKHANVEGKSTAIVCGAMDDISQLLDEGHNVYVFCSSRRDGDLIEDEFKHHNPVIYNAYTKGTARADAVLRNQRLTDSRLFIGTSAAGVGISILDEKARTVIVNGLKHGSRDASMAVQKCMRDRGRCGVSFHYSDYNLSLPVRPTENETVSLYHEALKIAENKPSHLPEAGIKKIARAEALASLADHQIETFISHHFGTVGNMPVYQASALRPSEDKIAIISEHRRSLIRTERQKKLATAIALLKTRNLLTSSEIRVRSNKGEMSPSQRLAYEAANGYACAIGWNDKIDRGAKQPFDEVLDDSDITIAIALAEKNINVEKLAKQRRGYIAVNFPNWTAYTLQTALANTESDLVDDSLGIEPTAIHDDRFRGELLRVLLSRLEGEVFDVSSLAAAVREVLKQHWADGQTFIGKIHRGALGASEYRKARFLAHADDDRVVDWASQFVSKWYPARIQKRDQHFVLAPAKNLQIRLDAFQRWLKHQPCPPDNMPTDLEISFQPTELPDPDAALKKQARSRRESGETIKSIADSLKRHVNTVSKWCKGINPPSPAEAEVLSILSDGKVWKTPDIVKHSRFTHQHISTALRKLVDTGAISRIKRGHYQKK